MSDDSKAADQTVANSNAGRSNLPTAALPETLDLSRAGMTIAAVMDRHGLRTGVHLTTEDEKRVTDALADDADHKYSIGETLAEGGMGRVLNVRDLNCRRNVAMKVMLGGEEASASTMSRFIEEAQITAQLQHPNIVPVYELGTDANGNVFYTMKLVKGTTLNDILLAIRDGDEEVIEEYTLMRLINIFHRVCDAIALAHSKGVVHRDLKPENVMIGDFGEVLVMDWGLAKVIGHSHPPPDPDDDEDDGVLISPFGPDHPLHHPPIVHEEEEIDSIRSSDTDDSAGKTIVGQVLGTPSFMAPEQASGRVDAIDTRTDIYELGGILYNILTLHPPVEGSSVDHVLTKVVQGVVPPPNAYDKGKKRASQGSQDGARLPHCPGGHIPESLAAVAMKALALRPEDRYRSVVALQREIESFQAGFATRAEEAGISKQASLLVKRHRQEALSAVIAVVIAVGITAFAFRRINREMEAARNSEKTAVESLQKLRRKLAETRIKNSREADLQLLSLARELMSRTLLEPNMWTLAEVAVERAVQQNPMQIETWRLKGRLHLGNLEFKPAIASFQRVLTLAENTDPNDRELLAIASDYNKKSDERQGSMPREDLSALARLFATQNEQALAARVRWHMAEMAP